MMNLKVFFGANKNAVAFIGVGVVIVLLLLFAIAKDNEKSKQPSISANQIVQHFEVYGYYRKFIGMSDDGFYIIQDFYSEKDTPRSNQYRVKSQDDLLKEQAQQTTIDGLYIRFRKNGNKEMEQHYANNQANGKYTEWWKNGNKKAEGYFVDGKENGFVTGWYRSGQKLLHVNMKDGKAHGKGVSWHENGKKSAEENFENNLYNGKSQSWYPSGVLSSEVWYDHDKILKCSQFSEDGIAVYENEVSPEICAGIVREFYSAPLESEAPDGL
jgi:antitoxin component YwqK of YwqJK toxin-antitoxin module